MDLGDLKYLDAPAKVLKLSEAVRKFGYTDSVDPYACVLGTAYKMTTGHSSCERHKFGLEGTTYVRATSELFGVPVAVCRMAESMCVHGKSPEEIANRLESQGY